MKVLSNFLLSILLDGKRGGNKDILGKKTSFEAIFLIFLLYNSFEDALLLLPLQPLIVSSSFCLLITKSGIGVFGKNNVEESKKDNPKSTGADTNGGIRVDNPGTRTDTDIGADNPGIAIDNPGTAADNPGTAADNPGITTDNLGIATNNLSIAVDNSGTAADNLGIATDNPGTKTDADVKADNSGTVVDNPGTKTDANARVDNLSTAASNKAHAASFFALRHAVFFLTSTSELVTASLPSSLPFSLSTILRSKPILSCLMTLVKQKAPSSKYLIDKM